jgi:fructose-bisphosphate aldolase class II
MGLRSALLVAAAGTSDAVRFAVGRAPQVRMGTAATDMGLPCKDECAVGKYPKMPPSVHPGVVTGQALVDLLAHAKEQQFAIPAVNCVSSSGINACLEAARACDAPIIIQFSSGGSQFYAGKGMDNKDFKAAIAGAVSGAYHVRAMAEQYGIPVILHTDHCAKKLLPWMDGMLAASERYYAVHGEPLFSSHMIDLSEEPMEENLKICQEYLARMSKMDMLLEMELGITGGEEDGVNNEDVAKEDLYTKPEEVYEVYKALQPIDSKFTVAAAFGNVHGVYAPGNVELDPEILANSNEFIDKELGGDGTGKPVSFVFHGGSGSDIKDIKRAIECGVIKMNIDTDTQWSYWSGVKEFESKYRPYLQTQIGNPDGAEKPNKKYYDPREMMRSAEVSTVDRLKQCFEDLNCVGRLGLEEAGDPSNVLGPRRGGLPN